MARYRTPVNDYVQSLLSVGPFGGIDPTTESYYVNQTNFIDMMNLIPNVGYGGYVVTPGRQIFSQIPNVLPYHIVAMEKFSTLTVENGYIVICDNGGNAEIYYCANGAQTFLPIPAGAMFRTQYVVDDITMTATPTMAIYGKWIFLTNGVDVPLKIDTSLNVSYWGIVAATTAPTAIAGATGNLTGTFVYTITYATADQESGQGFNASTGLEVISNAITVTAMMVLLTGVPTSPDPQVTKRNIYRLGGGNGTWNYVGTINDNTTTTFTDNVAAGNVGQVLVVYRDPPLPFKYIVEHQNCIFGFSAPGEPSLVYASNFDEPWGFSLSLQVWPVGDNSLTDPAMGMGSTGSVLGLVKGQTLYGLYGNSVSTFNVQEIAGIGGVSEGGILAEYGMLWYHSRQGFYVWNGSGGPTNISDGGFQKSNIKKFLDNIADIDLAQSVTWADDQMIGLSFPSLNVSYIYDQRSAAWYPISWATDVAVSDPNGLYRLLGQNLEAPGQVDLWFANGGDLGNEILAWITSGITNSGAPFSTKYYRYAIVECQPQNATLGLQVIVNTGLNQEQFNFAVAADNGGPSQQFSLPPTLKGSTVQIKLSIITDQVIHIQSASVHGWEERRYKLPDGATAR